MDLGYKTKKAISQPGDILPYFRRAALRALQIKRLVVDGSVFYQYKGRLYPEHLANRQAAPFIFDLAAKYCNGNGLDIGAGGSPFPGAIVIQELPDENAYKLDRFADGSLDYVFSSHCLEHLAQWQEALSLWLEKLRPGGILFLYLPHESMPLWRPGGLWAGNDHKWSPIYRTINEFLERNSIEILEYNAEKDDYWSFHIVGRKPADS